MWFDVIGNALAFVGSIIFSAALIKPKEQIRDENRSYWGDNYFTMKSELSTQPLFILAFVLLIIGFAISLGAKIGDLYADTDVRIPILFAVAISLAGCLATALLFIHRHTSHQKSKTAWRKNIFQSAARTHRNTMQGYIGRISVEDPFEANKSTYLEDLKSKLEKISDSESQNEQLLIEEIDGCSSPSQFVMAVDSYLER